MMYYIVTVLFYTIITVFQDYDYFFIDYFVSLPLCFTYGYTKPSLKLVNMRPPDSLASPPIVISLVGNILISAVAFFLVLIYIREQDIFI